MQNAHVQGRGDGSQPSNHHFPTSAGIMSGDAALNEQLEMNRVGAPFSLLSYINSSSASGAVNPNPSIIKREPSTEMNDLHPTRGNGGENVGRIPGTESTHLSDAQVGVDDVRDEEEGDYEEVEESDEDEANEGAPESGTRIDPGISKDSISLACAAAGISTDMFLKSGDMPPIDPSISTGLAMDIPLGMGLAPSSSVLKFQTEDADLISYYSVKAGKRARSLSTSNSDPKWSVESKMFNDSMGDMGLPYYTREPSAALNRLSGGLKYNGRWSSTMSDIAGGGIEASANGSTGLLSLIIPEVGGPRGSYSNSVSPLGMTLTTPCASPRTAIAFTHKGFQSPHQSFSMAEK